jgi:hypothetical protein
MYLNGEAYLITLSKTMHREGGHFVVWDEQGGAPVMKVEHGPIVDDHEVITGIKLVGMTRDGIVVGTSWMNYDRAHQEVHGLHSFILEVGGLVGEARAIRQQREEAFVESAKDD